MSSLPTSSSSSEPNAVEAFAGLLDVRCRVEAVLGVGRLTVRECLALAPNAIVRLGRPAGSDLEIRSGGVTLAAGEVIVLEDSTAIRLTSVAGAEGDVC